MAELSRRTFLALGATVVASACSSSDDQATPSPSSNTASSVSTSSTTSSTASSTPATTAPLLSSDPFQLGVSSGDPDETSAVLWTRLVGDDLPDSVEVAWELAEDPSFQTATSSGPATADATNGHSVHAVVELTGPAWFRFRIGAWVSAVGRVLPAPSGPAEQVRLATASCQHWETGFYAAHRDLAEWAPDLVVFLGDFIYEDAGRPVADGRVRSHDGGEITDLAAYRDRYAQYLSDPDLRGARAAAPWLVVWDDHEVDNNYAGAAPDDPTGTTDFLMRRAAAYRAWWEHMPVRLPPPDDGPYIIHRAIRWGELAGLILLDGRQYRSDQACGDVALSTEPVCPEALDPARTMLGAAQEGWVGDALAATGTTWTVVGQQTVLTDLRLNGAILNYDQWDGYAPARERLLAQAAATERLVVLTGDVHLAGVGRLPGVGVEFVTTSISSSSNIDPSLQPVLDSFETVVAAELNSRGYTRHTVTPQSWTAEYRIVGDVRNAASPVATWQTFRVDAAARDVVRAV